MEDEPPGYHEATRSSSATTSLIEGSTQEDRNTEYALLSLSRTDRIRLMRFPEQATTLVTEVVKEWWPKGIQNIGPYEETMEIKLRGNPFAHGNDEEKIAIRKVMLEILNALAKEGWRVLPAGVLGRIGGYGMHGEKGSLIFQRQPPQQLSWVCVSFDSSDLIHLINTPFELVKFIVGAFGDRIERCNHDLVSENFEIKVKEKLWSQHHGKSAVQGRLAVLDMLQCLAAHGLTLCASLELDYGNGADLYKSGGETWFCCR